MENEELKMDKKNSVIFLLSMLVIICIWIFTYAIWDFTGKRLSHRVLTKILEFSTFIISICYVRINKIKRDDMGLNTTNITNVIIKNIIFSALFIVILALIKFILINTSFNFFNTNKPFWNWNVMSWSRWIYPITVFMQQFLINGVVHESLNKILEGKNKTFVVIIIAALYFGAIHIHKGLGYMLGACAMCIVLCMVYRKQRTIWGISISHYLLGMAAKFLGYI